MVEAFSAASEGVPQFGQESLTATLDYLQKRTNEMIKAESEEESKGESLREPLQITWTKEALAIITQHLTEQQKIALLSEQLTLLTYQPQEATGDDVNFKEELKQICEQLTFEVEQKELAVLAAPTRLLQKRLAVEAVYNKFKSELEMVENGFLKPQIDRENNDEDESSSALSLFTEGYQKFVEQNQNEVDDIENQQISFREGKKELIESIRALIDDFKKQVRSSSSVVSLRSLFTRHYHLTGVRGLTDISLIKGSVTWPEEKDFAHIPPSQLREIQLQTVHYYKVGSILSMQFTLSCGGLTSPFAGNSGISKCDQVCHLPANRPIRKIRLKASKNWVNEIRFCDENDYTIGEVKADSGVGEWHDFILEKGERVVGFQAEHDSEQYVRRFGFITFKP